MSRLAVLILSCCLAAPVAAEGPAPDAPGEIEQGADLLEQGARLLLRGLLAEIEPTMREMGSALAELEPAMRDLARMIGDIRNYHAPEMLPNGDIILRRKVPLVPDEPLGEIDL
ncbi:MAG: AAA+ family ATPase [Gemmobacter sp.]